jgi:hypothetical protein
MLLCECRYGDTALHLAASYGQVDACAMLIQRNADINSRDQSGKTPCVNTNVTSCFAFKFEIMFEFAFAFVFELELEIEIEIAF